MLRRVLSVMLIAVSAMRLAADTVIADSLYITDTASPMRELMYLLRFKPDKYYDINVDLYWNYSDSTFVKAEFSIPPLTAIDNTDMALFECRIYEKSDRGENLLATYDDAVRYDRGRDAAFSSLLRADANGATLAFGDKHAQTAHNVNFNRYIPCTLAFSTDRKADLVAHTLITRRGELRRHCEGEFDTNTDNPVTGVWSYLDRDTDPEKVAGAIDYKIAVVADTTGEYRIIYLGNDSLGWRRGDVKGYLKATPFEGHYNLEWHDHSGNVHNVDASADLLLDGKVLRLNLPLIGTTLRFVKD